MMRPTLSLSLLLLAPTLLLGGCRKKVEEAADVTVAVQMQHPTRGPIAEEISADAVLAPLAQAAISPRISSPIRAEYVQRGAHVHAGQLLITLEDRDLQGSALDSKGSLSSAEATYAAAVGATIPEDLQKAQLDVAQSKANLDVAAQTSADRKQLFEQGALPGRDADIAAAAKVQAQAAYDTTTQHLAAVLATTREANKKAAEGQLNSAKGRYISAEAQVSYASLRSPIAGVVTERPFFPGETAVAGTTVITIMDTSALLAKLHVAQAEAQNLKIGGNAQVTSPGIDEPVDATVSFISPALDPGSTTVEIWLKIVNTDGRFKVGTPVHAVIHGGAIADSLQVPPSALLPAQDGATNVMVAGADNTAHLRAVKVGIRTPTSVQIIDGLLPSDEVVTEGSYGLDDGTKVKATAVAVSAQGKD